MEIITFVTEESNWKHPRVGALLNREYLFDFAAAFGHEQPADLLAWFDLDGQWFQQSREKWEEIKSDPDLQSAAIEKQWLIRRKDAYWLAPVPRPGKLICIGLNY